MAKYLDAIEVFLNNFSLLGVNQFIYQEWNRRCSVKKVFLKASQNSQENTCAGVSLFLETLLKNGSSSGVFLWNLRICSGHLPCRTPKNGCFCVDYFVEVFRKFQKILRAPIKKCSWYVLSILQFWRETCTSSLIKKL